MGLRWQVSLNRTGRNRPPVLKIERLGLRVREVFLAVSCAVNFAHAERRAVSHSNRLAAHVKASLQSKASGSLDGEGQ